MTEFTAPGVEGLDPDKFDHLAADAGPGPTLSTYAGDPDLEALTGGNPAAGMGAGSELDDLKAELHADVTATEVLAVDGRPRYSVRFRTDFTGKDLDLCRQLSRDKSYEDKLDGVKFGALLLAKTCVHILRDGQVLELGGKVATLTEPEFMDLMLRPDERGPLKAVDVVRRFYGLDGHVDAAARKLLEVAGWGDEARKADPTA